MWSDLRYFIVYKNSYTGRENISLKLFPVIADSDIIAFHLKPYDTV